MVVPVAFHCNLPRCLFARVALAPVRWRQVQAVLAVVTCLAWERRVVMFSRRLWLLAEAGEALLALLFPFSWQHVYIPVLPHSLAADYIQVRAVQLCAQWSAP